MYFCIVYGILAFLIDVACVFISFFQCRRYRRCVNRYRFTFLPLCATDPWPIPTLGTCHIYLDDNNSVVLVGVFVIFPLILASQTRVSGPYVFGQGVWFYIDFALNGRPYHDGYGQRYAVGIVVLVKQNSCTGLREARSLSYAY